MTSINQSRQTRMRPQDPEEVANMDEYQFADEKHSTKRSKSIFCWGFSSTGALGRQSHLGRYEKATGQIEIPKRTVIRSPQRLRFVNPRCHVYDVAAGSGFTVIAATYDGSTHVLFGCGLNTDSQIGFQSNQSNEPLICVAEPVPIDLPLNNSNKKNMEKVVKVACGRAHTVCLTNHNNVFTLGNNSFGQCGRPIVEDEKYFASKRVHQIDYDQNDPIVDICCGLDHTLALTRSGIVYSFGWGDDGQLGHGVCRSSWKLSKVIGDIQGEKIIKISSAGDCVLAINEKGQMFGWGNNEYGQLAMANNVNQTQIHTSRHLKVDNNSIGKISDVAAAGSMCALINDSGSIFVWGYGILGLGPNIREKLWPTELHANLFGRNVLNMDTKITKIIAGLHHFGAINNRGELFMWGKNNRANLGIGTKHDMMFPFRISIPTHVIKLSLGIDHSIAVGYRLI
ncbi:williams-beuren syndrome chromosomal region 16 protein-like protein [Dermatophagoides farinae]|uniref:Williams-beuren syndrome chromosomal region 16 protein-like protein n=3 Tax=Dermatophagoides farinae TaxID=6954 RepID=A0A9D4P8K6_DERFA|nr:williams-beuren syndrome chromosomal region 16 protein-like protein [Dermatophagoides farinae]